jgi:hypothetical protein
MQFIAKNLLTLELDGTPNDSSPGGEAERVLLSAEIAAESLRVSGRLRLRVRGESMLPTLWPGDVVEIASCSEADVRPGEIVLALRDGRFFLHRLIARSAADGFLLRGDSMPEDDPEFSIGALIGRLVSCPRAALPWVRVVGRILCYCGPARRLALRVHAGRQPRDTWTDGLTCVDRHLAQSRGQQCSRHTIPSQSISELPHAGV